MSSKQSGQQGQQGMEDPTLKGQNIKGQGMGSGQQGMSTGQQGMSTGQTEQTSKQQGSKGSDKPVVQWSHLLLYLKYVSIIFNSSNYFYLISIIILHSICWDFKPNPIFWKLKNYKRKETYKLLINKCITNPEMLSLNHKVYIIWLYYKK